MLNKYKDVKPQKGVNKPFEKCFHVCGIFRILFRERTPHFDIFSRVFFSGKSILKHKLLRIKKTLGGPGACSSENFLKIYVL